MADMANGSTDANGTPAGSKLLWRHPDPQSTAMHRYLQAVNQSHNLRLSTYSDLHQWSIENIDAFWQSVWKFVGIRAEGDASPVSSALP
jgi:acetoacetyl-CoA synthetase